MTSPISATKIAAMIGPTPFDRLDGFVAGMAGATLREFGFDHEQLTGVRVTPEMLASLRAAPPT